MIKIMKAMVAALIALAVVAAASAATGQEEPAPEDNGGQDQECKHGRFGRMGRVLEGDIEVLDEDGNVKHVHFVNGEVSNVSDSGFTLTKADESTVEIGVNDATEIFPPDTGLDDLDGKRVHVVTESADSNVATKVMAKPMRGHGRHHGPPPGAEGEESSFRGPGPEGFTL